MITKMDVLKDLLECMEVDEHVIDHITKAVILNLGEKEKELKDQKHEELMRHSRELREEAKSSFRNGDMSKLSKKEQRKLKRKMKLAKEKDIEDEEVEVKKEKKGSHLIPKEKVEYPRELLKHKELGALLKAHEKGGEEGRKARKAMRKLGFKLSDQSTWKSFIKQVK